MLGSNDKAYTTKIQDSFVIKLLYLVNQNVNNRPQQWVDGLVTPAF